MDAKLKAKQLVNKFKGPMPTAAYYVIDESAKDCALIAVDVLIEVTDNADDLVTKLIGLLPVKDIVYFKEANESKAGMFWRNVKEEIIKL